jgi:predicted permease
MFRSAIKSQRLVVVFLLGALLFNYPLLALFNRSASVADIPVLYLYIFGAWALLIGLAALVVERSR